MSLLQCLSYKDYQKALTFNLEQCEAVAKLADLRNISFENAKRPGQNLIKTLDRQGITVDQYKEFVSSIQKRKQNIYKPNSKVAVIIGNDKYVNLSQLVTPPTDSSLLSNNLKNLGFNVIILRNTTSKPLKEVLEKIFSVVPEGSYCVIFYAGHGGNSNNQVTCMLSVDCPTSAIQSEHCITENNVLEAVAMCKPDLCLFVMDMCRINLDRLRYCFGGAYSYFQACTHEKQEKKVALEIRQFQSVRANHPIICYSTQESSSAYEAVQLYCSNTLDTNMTYEMKTEDLDIVVPNGSQYVNALCRRIGEDIDVGLLMDKVHSDVANSVKFQKPIKIQRVIDVKRSLHDPAIGDAKSLLNELKEIGKEFYESLS